MDNLQRLESNFDEFREQKKADKLLLKEYRKQALRDISSEGRGTDSSGHSYFDSEASRIDFWKDINTNDSDYVNALIISKNKANI